MNDNRLQSLLCLNGIIPQASFFTKFSHLPLVSADGAYSQLEKRGVRPHYVCGDFDSCLLLPPAPNLTTEQTSDDFTQKIHDADQDCTDFEKCLALLEKKKLFPTLVCGIGGGEVDHAHNNLAIFMKASRVFDLYFFDGSGSEIDGEKEKIEKRKARYGFGVYQEIHLKVKIGSTISLLAFPSAVVTTKGLMWPLIQEELHIMGRSGARNCAAEEWVSVIIHQGAILLTVDASGLFEYRG